MHSLCQSKQIHIDYIVEFLFASQSGGARAAVLLFASQSGTMVKLTREIIDMYIAYQRLSSLLDQVDDIEEEINENIIEVFSQHPEIGTPESWTNFATILKSMFYHLNSE